MQIFDLLVFQDKRQPEAGLPLYQQNINRAVRLSENAIALGSQIQ
jgi:hypothetical protein